MNKIIFRRRNPFSLYFSHATHNKNLHFLRSGVASFSVYKTENQYQKVPLLFKRQMSVASYIKGKLNKIIPDATKAKMGACLAYEKIGDDIDYNEFLQCFELPDTFQSWFLAMQLHVWMTILATNPHQNGKTFKLILSDSMWNDVELRMEKLTTLKSSTRKKHLKELVMQFHGCLIAFDEGILSEDTVLAAAAWRTLFDCKPVHPHLLENAVLYVRKQLAHLQSQNIENIVYRGTVSFLPLNSILSEDKM